MSIFPCIAGVLRGALTHRKPKLYQPRSTATARQTHSPTIAARADGGRICLEMRNMDTVSFVTMAEGTREDYDLLTRA